MSKEKITQEIERTNQQINNLEIINESTDINMDIPEKKILDKVYDDLKTFGKHERNLLLSQLSKLEGMNNENKKFSTMRPEQRSFLLVKLKDKKKDLESKLHDDTAKEA